MFLLSSINMKLRPKILDLKPGTRIVSNTFDMANENPTRQPRSAAAKAGAPPICGSCGESRRTWKLPQGELSLKQTFQ